MTDILIRNVPDDLIAAVDAKALRMGLSRTEYLRRTLARERNAERYDVSVELLQRLAAVFSDLDNAEAMASAWS